MHEILVGRACEITKWPACDADHFRCPREPGYVDLHPVTRTILNDPRTSPVSKYAAEGKWPVFAIRSKKIARGLVLALVAGCSSTPDAARQAAELDQRLNNSLSGEVQDNRLLITQLPAGAKLTLDSRLLFPAYSAQLDERGQQLLNRVIEALFDVPKTRVAVDGCPGGPAVASNCQLSGARASSMIHYLQGQGFAPGLLSVTNGSAPIAAAVPANSAPAVWNGNMIVMTITDGTT